VFNKASEVESIKLLAVVADITAVSLAPTPAPTPSPTYAGFKVVEEKKEVQAIETALKFPLTAAEAKNPAMQKSITSGIAASLGLGSDSVKILEIDGVPLRRRLATDIDIKFQITAAEATAGSSELTTLKDDVAAAASEGAMIANIKKEAASNGVLVQSLKDMPLEQTVVTTTKAVTITVQKQVLATSAAAPTPAAAAPTPATAAPTPAAAAPTPAPKFSAASVPAFSSLALTLCLATVAVMAN
jgi:hypothetical protein